MWIRYKHRWASHEDKKWTYHEIPDDWQDYGYSLDSHRINDLGKESRLEVALGDFIENETDITKANNWSDKYRGIRWEAINVLPYEEIEKRIKLCKNNIESWEWRLKRFEEMLENTGEITKKEMEV